MIKLRDLLTEAKNDLLASRVWDYIIYNEMWVTENSLKEVSLDNLYKINNPAIINPKLLNVLTGSLNGPSLILSHQREASPIKAIESTDWISWK